MFFGAVINPNDNRYLYAVLKSYLFNIPEKDLTEARKNGYHFNVLNNPDEYNISNRLYNALLQIREYSIDAKTFNSSSLFSKIINNVEAFKKQGNENMEYVYFALELLKSRESNKK